MKILNVLNKFLWAFVLVMSFVGGSIFAEELNPCDIDVHQHQFSIPKDLELEAWCKGGSRWSHYQVGVYKSSDLFSFVGAIVIFDEENLSEFFQIKFWSSRQKDLSVCAPTTSGRLQVEMFNVDPTHKRAEVMKITQNGETEKIHCQR